MKRLKTWQITVLISVSILVGFGAGLASKKEEDPAMTTFQTLARENCFHHAGGRGVSLEEARRLCGDSDRR